MLTSINTLIPAWRASVYEKTHCAQPVAECITRFIGSRPLSVLEPGCGTGKIARCLREKHHTVTGMDTDSDMLKYAFASAKGDPGLLLINADILTSAWPKDFDAVILAEDLMHTLITDWEYKQAQKQLIIKSANSLKKKGLLFLDFYCPLSFASCGSTTDEHIILEGTDENGIYGRMRILHLEADEKTRLVKSRHLYDLTLPSGKTLHTERTLITHHLSLEETTAWLYRTGFTIEALYGSLRGDPFDEDNRRCVLLARKE